MKKRAIVMVLMTVFSLSVLFGLGKVPEKTKEVTEEYVPVEVEEVRLHTLSEKIELSGEVFPEKKADVVPSVPSRVSTVSVSVGDTVKKGDLLFKVESVELERQVSQAKKALDVSETNYNNMKKQLGSASRELDSLRLQVEQAQLAYDQANESLKSSSIVSPIDGVVSEINIREGETATNTRPTVVVIDKSHMYVRVDVSERLLDKVSLGDKAVVDLRNSDSTLEGEVELISPAVDERTKLYFINISLNDAVDYLRPGMFVRVSVDTAPKEDVLAVETDSVFEEDEKSYVFVETDSRAEMREVVTGIESGDYTEIISGLSLGDMVLTKGQDFAEDGTRVRVSRGDE